MFVLTQGFSLDAEERESAGSVKSTPQSFLREAHFILCGEERAQVYQEDLMNISWRRSSILSLCVSLALSSFAYGHGEGGVSAKNLVRISFTPNPSVPEFASASGIALISLAEGVIQLEDLTGFPFDTAGNRILPVNVNSTIDPRLKGHGGEPGSTSCEPESTSETGESIGPWTCHVHSYVVWLAELEDGALGHPIHLGTIYPRTDGTAADRNFSFREGDVSGFGANVIIITAEVSIGALPSLSHGHDGHEAMQLVPLGPIVLQANLP